MINILIGQKIHPETVVLSNPTKLNIGFASQTAREPVMANTTHIIIS